MKPIIYFDVDGVLLDYSRAFLEFSGLKGRGVEYEHLISYDLTELFDTPQECHATMNRFRDSEYFRTLQPLVPTYQLEMLKNAGFELKCLTQVSGTAKNKYDRVKNLTLAFGPVFSDIEFTNHKECKLDKLIQKSYYSPERDYIIIEDNPTLLHRIDRHILDDVRINGFRTTKINAMAIRHPYNEEALTSLDAILVFDDVAQVVEHLIHRTHGVDGV